MNTLLDHAIQEVKKQPKLTKEELMYNEFIAVKLFNGKTVFESFK